VSRRAGSPAAVRAAGVEPARVREPARYLALVLDVLTLEGDQIASVTAFIAAEGFTEQSPGGRFARADFARFGLPLELPG
jgi:hypothetical protein